MLSDPEGKRHYDDKLRASSGRGSGRPRTRPGGRTGGETATTVDLSDLLSKLSDRSGGHKEGSFRLRGEETKEREGQKGAERREEGEGSESTEKEKGRLS